ncbi:glycosyltransferase family 39 protein [bacterium]|nr:glycosyltransferase family 39 protein [bacterium]MBU1880710.1 glycosyltransferase family 39 protein [bacterium]
MFKKIYSYFEVNETRRIRTIILIAFALRFLSILPHGNDIVVPYRDQNTYYATGRCIVEEGFLGVPSKAVGPYIEHRNQNPKPHDYYPSFHDSIAAVWEAEGTIYGVVKWGGPNSFFEPLYPLLTAGMYRVFGDNFFFWRMIHVILGTLLVYFIYDIGLRAFKDWRVATLAALWVTFYPNAIFYSWILMAEVLLLVLLAAGFWAYFRLLDKPTWQGALLVGILFGLFALTRSFIIAFFPFMVIYIFLFVKNKKRLQFALLAALGFAVVFTPWIIRNSMLHNQLVIMSTRGGYNIWMRNNPYFIEDEYRAMGVEFSQEKLAKLKYHEYILGYPEFNEDQGELERNAILTEQGKKFISQNPGFFLELCWVRFIWTIGWKGIGLKGPLLNGISFLAYMPALVGFILSLFVGWKRLQVTLPLWSVVGYFVLFYSLTHEGLRYRLPVDPYMILLAIFSFLYLYANLKKEPFPKM